MLSSEVHPVDNNSVRYNFSSTTSPLLNSTAWALNVGTVDNAKGRPTFISFSVHISHLGVLRLHYERSFYRTVPSVFLHARLRVRPFLPSHTTNTDLL